MFSRSLVSLTQKNSPFPLNNFHPIFPQKNCFTDFSVRTLNKRKSNKNVTKSARTYPLNQYLSISFKFKLFFIKQRYRKLFFIQLNLLCSVFFDKQAKRKKTEERESNNSEIKELCWILFIFKSYLMKFSS